MFCASEASKDNRPPRVSRCRRRCTLPFAQRQEARFAVFADAASLAETPVNMGDFCRDARGEVRQQKRGHIAHFIDGDVAANR